MPTVKRIVYLLIKVLPGLVRITILLILLLSQSVYAEDLTLDRCIKISLERSESLKIAREKMQAARVMKSESFAHFFPEGNLQLIYSRFQEIPEVKNSFNVPIGINPVTGAIIYAPVSMNLKLGYDYLYSAKLSVTQPVYTSGKLRLSYHQTELNYRIAEAEIEKVQIEVMHNVRRSFYGVLLAQQMLKIAQEAVDVTQDHFNVMQEMYNNGRISRYDLSRVKVQLVNSQTQVIKAKNGLILAKESLYTVLRDEQVKGEPISGDLTMQEGKLPELETLIHQSQVQRPELQQLVIQQQIAAVMVKLTAALDQPNLSLALGYEYKNPYYYDEKWDGAWNAALVFIWPFNFYNSHKIVQTKSTVNQLGLTEKQLRNFIELEVKKAYYDMQEAKERVEAQRENINLAKDNLNIAQERYRQGLMASIEVRDAQLSLTQTEVNYYQAMFDYNIAKASLDKATGKQ